MVPLSKPAFSVFLLSAAISCACFYGCQEPPAVSFTYSPVENPETGDTITFRNRTIGADTFTWDFGDGTSSTEDSPRKVYENTGIKVVSLTASNDGGDAVCSDSIFINPPTELHFKVMNLEDGVPLKNCDVYLYDNTSDLDNFNTPQHYTITDDNGFAAFQNLERQVYYFIIAREAKVGLWVRIDHTPNITLNEINSQDVFCYFFPGTTLDEILNPS
jgi:hypothetical protein